MVVLLKADQQDLNKKVRSQALCVGDLVLKIAEHIQKELNTLSLLLNGKNLISLEKLRTVPTYEPNSKDLLSPINAKWLKLYYPYREIKTIPRFGKA